jgi:hypothetical protein
LIELVNPQCYAVFANLQGSKDNLCPFFHHVNSESSRRRGNIEKLSCDVKFYFFTPTFNRDSIPLTQNIAILCYGEHTHPPPPPPKIPQNVKDNLIQVVQAFGAAEATARKIIASPLLPIMFNGKTTLAEEHIALTNHSAVNHIIRRERLRRHPLGTGFEGAQHLMIQRGPENPYIRQCYQFPDGHFVILCQLKAQSHLLF